jgi:nicotinamidase-related amidase
MTERFHSLDPETSVVLVIDLQERLARAMDPQAWDGVEKSVVKLVRGAGLLAVPVVATEQYPRGLGPTVGSVGTLLGAAPVEKTDFSCWREAGVRAALEAAGRKQVVICGMEAHVCVFQTVRDLVGAGYSPYVVSEAVLSRTAENRALGLSLMREAGAVVTGLEVVLFDWLGGSQHPRFRDVSTLIR